MTFSCGSSYSTGSSYSCGSYDRSCPSEPHITITQGSGCFDIYDYSKDPPEFTGVVVCPGNDTSGPSNHDTRDPYYSQRDGNDVSSYESSAQSIAQSYGSTYSSGQDARGPSIKEKNVNQIDPSTLQGLHEVMQEYAKANQVFGQSVQQFTQTVQSLGNLIPSLQTTNQQLQATNQKLHNFLTLNKDKIHAVSKKKLQDYVPSSIYEITPDGSIESISRSILKGPLPTAMDLGRKMLSVICKSNPWIRQACQNVGLQNILIRERALVLTGKASVDFNGAYCLSMFKNLDKTLVFLELERNYDVAYQRVGDVKSFCRAIDEETARNGPIHLLILTAHGHQHGVQLDTDQTFTTLDPLPLDSCLQNLSSNTTIILNSCSTGRGRENADNFANYIKEHSPVDVRIFSSIEDTPGFIFSLNEQIEVKFRPSSGFRPGISNIPGLESDITYKIDN